jgi:single-strand DNA-binding protein
MYNVNRIELIGNVGADPETRYTPNGTPYTRITLATNERWKDRAGEPKESTEWHSVIFWGPQAEIAGKYLKKGSFVFVEGSLKSRKYTDKKDNVERRVWEVRATRLGFLDRRERPEGDAGPSEPPVDNAPPSDDDIPF